LPDWPPLLVDTAVTRSADWASELDFQVATQLSFGIWWSAVNPDDLVELDKDRTRDLVQALANLGWFKGPRDGNQWTPEMDTALNNFCQAEFSTPVTSTNRDGKPYVPVWLIQFVVTGEARGVLAKAPSK